MVEGGYKLSLPVRCFLLFYFSLGVLLNLPYTYFTNNINTPPVEYNSEYLASPSTVQFDVYEYYTEVCKITLWTVEQFELLLDEYSIKYGPIKDKINSFDKSKTDTSNKETLEKNAEYCLIYIDELTKIVEDSGLDKYVEQDYNKIIDKGSK